MIASCTPAPSRRRPTIDELALKRSPYYGLVKFWAPGPGRKPIKTGPKTKTLVLGLISAGLYFLLYEYQDTLVHLAELTRQGEKQDALVPIGTALVFSGVHGKFTDSFWQTLGVQPKST